MHPAQPGPVSSAQQAVRDPEWRSICELVDGGWAPTQLQSDERVARGREIETLYGIEAAQA